MNYQETLAKCQEFGFNEDITRKQLWNTAYRLGRSRWYWGPSLVVTGVGWFNTVKWRLKNLWHH